MIVLILNSISFKLKIFQSSRFFNEFKILKHFSCITHHAAAHCSSGTWTHMKFGAAADLASSRLDHLMGVGGVQALRFYLVPNLRHNNKCILKNKKVNPCYIKMPILFVGISCCLNRKMGFCFALPGSKNSILVTSLHFTSHKKTPNIFTISSWKCRLHFLLVYCES